MKRELQKSVVNIATKNDLPREIESVWRNIELDYMKTFTSPYLTAYLGDFKVRLSEYGVKTGAHKM